MRNKYQRNGDTVDIYLNNGLVTTVSACDLPTAEGFAYLSASYDETIDGYYVIGPRNGKLEKLHTAIMNPPPGMEVDHRSRNTLDNTRSNLRNVTKSVNEHNQRRRKDNTSGHKGVSWVKHCGKWRARIQINGRPIHLGMFDDPVQAAGVVEEARKNYLRGAV